MQLVDQSVKLLSNVDNIQHISNCARVCYNSWDKVKGDITEANIKLYNNLIKSGHVSMLRHGTLYLAIPLFGATIIELNKALKGFESFIQKETKLNYCYYAINYNTLLDIKNGKNKIGKYDIEKKCSNYIVTSEEILKEVPNIYRVTLEIDTSIAMSREFNRVSPNSIAERSTRYINSSNYKNGISFITPHWFDNNDNAKQILLSCYEKTEEYYNELIRLGLKPEDARDVLPLGVYTKVIYTYSIKEWKFIIDKRLYNSTGKAHPQANALAELILNEIKKINI